MLAMYCRVVPVCVLLELISGFVVALQSKGSHIEHRGAKHDSWRNERLTTRLSLRLRSNGTAPYELGLSCQSADVPSDEREALVELFSATNGGATSWKESTGWGTNQCAAGSE